MFARSTFSTGRSPTDTLAPDSWSGPASRSTTSDTSCRASTSSARISPRPGARVLEQVAHEIARLPGGGGDPVDDLVALAELLAVAALEQLHVHRDRDERRLEVVRGDGGEAVELLVRALELARALGDLDAVALERLGHRVERAGEVADLVLGGLRHARRGVALGELRGSRPRRPARGAPRSGAGTGRCRRRARTRSTRPREPGADGQRRPALGALLAVARHGALLLEEAVEAHPDRVDPGAAGAVHDHAPRRRQLLAREVEQRPPPEVHVVVDLAPRSGRWPPAGTGSSATSDSSLRTCARVVLEGVPPGLERALTPGRDIAAEAVLEVEHRALELAARRDRLLGAEREPAGVALPGHGKMSSTNAAPRTSVMAPLTTRTRAVIPLKIPECTGRCASFAQHPL